MGTINKIYWTYAMLRAKIYADIDLEEETFVTPAEFLGYVNDAIDTSEQIVNTLYEDYFLSRAVLTLTTGQELYPLPVDIYAHKIRRVIFSMQGQIHKVQRIPDWKKFEHLALNSYSNSGNVYSYFLINTSPGVPQMLVTPLPKETGPNATVWYIRQANRLEVDADILDIPEAYKFIVSYVKEKCMFKEQNPAYGSQKENTALEKDLLESTLATMVPDADNEIEADYSAYEDHS
jgi:hypothetical protein